MLSKKYSRSNEDLLEERVQLIALPYAAGSLRSYQPFNKVDGIELVKYELPGRGFRQSDQFSGLSTILAEVIEIIDFTRPYILFGHSMGAYITYELCSFIEKKELPLPSKVILSAQIPPSNKNDHRTWHKLSKNEVRQYFEKLGGTPDEILNSQELMEFFSDVLNQDFAFLRSYFKNGWTEKVQSNLEIWYGEDDDFIDEKGVAIWDQYTCGKCKYVKFQGNHFFIHQLFEQPERLRKLFLEN